MLPRVRLVNVAISVAATLRGHCREATPPDPKSDKVAGRKATPSHPKAGYHGVRMVCGSCTDGVRIVYGSCTDGVQKHSRAKR
jgi:hypothetical protein